MKKNEIEIIRQIRSGSVKEKDLIDIFDNQRNNYRIRFHLVQHPRFPVKIALNIIQQLFTMDLIRLMKNRRANPFIRKKAETEFLTRCQRLALGEKISILKTAPAQVLNHFIEENDSRILNVILKNQECTEELILKFINRKTQKSEFYRALQLSDWYKRPAITEAIIRDQEAPIKLILDMIPILKTAQLKKLYHNENTHEIVKEIIMSHFRNDGPGQ